jgi:hypothetical protein
MSTAVDRHPMNFAGLPLVPGRSRSGSGWRLWTPAADCLPKQVFLLSGRIDAETIGLVLKHR